MSNESMNSARVNKAVDDELDRRVLRALETAPSVEIPTDFAARVASRLPARRRPVSLTPTHYGRTAVFLGMILTLVVLIALTLHNGRHATFGLAESLLLTQFLALTVWLSVRRYSVG
jgi:ABC-type transport system involved in cytochrome c biogenesis permease subunit